MIMADCGKTTASSSLGVLRSLKSDEKKHHEELKGLKGVAFDVAYIDHEVEDHQKALGLFDKT